MGAEGSRVEHTIVCTSCGSRIAATRERCPRCRARVSRADPAAYAARSRRVARAAGIVLGTSVLGLGAFLWVQRSEAEPAVAVKPSDPLAGRRLAPVTIASGTLGGAEAGRPFLDPAGQGVTAYTAGDHQTALARFEEAVRNNPRDAESLSNQGQVLVRLGRVEEALPLFERACALNPERWTYRFNLARAFSLLARWDESIASYRQAQQLFPDDFVTTFNLALTLHKKGDEPAAVEEYRKAVALNPEDPSFRMALGISYEALRKNQEAAAAYGEYLRLAPNAPDADKVRARIGLLTGQPG